MVIWRADCDDAGCAVIINCNVCTSLLLDGVDDLALRPDNFTDFVERNCEGHNFRSRISNS